MVTDTHRILASWRNYFSQLLNEIGVKDVKQKEIHAAEPLVPEPSVFDFRLVIEKLKRRKSPVIDQIPAELIKTGGRIIRSEIHVLFNPINSKEELPSESKESIIEPIYKKGDKTL